MNEDQIKVCLDELNTREAKLAELRYKLVQAEKSLKHCDEICDSYAKFGHRTEANDIRYNAIKEIIRRYHDKDHPVNSLNPIEEKEVKDDKNPELQSKSD